MRKKMLVYRQALVFFALIVTNYTVTILIALSLRLVPLVNLIGFLALVTYIVTLIPGIFRKVFPKTKRTRILVVLLKYRRYIGVTAFGFSLAHAFLMTIQKDINWLEIHSFIKYGQGVVSLTIFTILSITSNNWSVRALKKNWHKLHQLTYIVIFILPWHILDKMSGHWSYLTPIAILLMFVIMVLFIQRKWLEMRI